MADILAIQGTADTSDIKQDEIIADNSSPPVRLVVPGFYSKPMPTKIMMQQTIKALSSQFRKGFSLAKMRNYILHNYLLTPTEAKHRLPFMKKLFKAALENGDVVSVKGKGLTGSFRVPATSPLHKNFQANERKIKRDRTKKNKGIVKKHKVEKGPVRKPKKLKKMPKTFSASY